MIRRFLYSLILLTALSVTEYAQPYNVDLSLRRIGFHTGNRAGISFYNDGQIAGYNLGTDIRGEWPLGSGNNYIGDMIPLIGVQFVNMDNDTLQSVIIARGPRNGQATERDPNFGYFWGWNPLDGYLNPNEESVAMSHLPESYPLAGWADPGGFPEVKTWVNEFGETEWWGYFGRGIKNADQESFFVAFDQADDEFNNPDNTGRATLFMPDSTDPYRLGMGLQLMQRGFQWTSFLAEDVIFWLYDIRNEGTYNYRKANFGSIIGTLAGGDGDSNDDLGFFDALDWITYSWDNDNSGNRGQEVGYVGYAFLESPGNAFDGIDNDGDSEMPSPQFTEDDFIPVTYDLGEKVVLIDAQTYERTLFEVPADTVTVYSLGLPFRIYPGVTLREGHIGSTQQGVSIPHVTAYDGFDNDLDGIIDENLAIHVRARTVKEQDPLKYIDYVSGAGLNDPLIDERRDNDIDEDGDWVAATDDVGADGLGPEDDGYPGPDMGEGDGVPTQGEPNFGRTDPDESDQIGLTSFNFFNQTQSPDLSNDSLVWSRMTPGRFDVISRQPQDGDFIYASGFFPLRGRDDVTGLPSVERFSTAILFGEDYNDILNNKRIVQQIYNAGYKFPQPPPKPEVTLAQDDGNVVIYWDGEDSENTIDFITKKNDFQGYKIYRSTDAGFRDARTITNGYGVLTFDEPLVQYDLDDDVSGFYYPSPELLRQVGGVTYYLGDNTGLVHSYVDTTAVKGQTYYYAVVAYDHGDDSLDIFPSENSKFVFITNTGEIQTDDNTGVITPGFRPAGFDGAAALEFQKEETYRATGEAFVEIVDEAAIMDGYSYKVVFSDTGLASITKDWSLVDLQRPDTVYIPLTDERKVVYPTETITIPEGEDTIYVNNRRMAINSTTYTAPYDTLVKSATNFSGDTPIKDGFRMQMYNDWTITIDTSKTGWDDREGKPSYSFSRPFFADYQKANGVKVPYNYRIEFYPEIVDTSISDTVGRPFLSSSILPPQPVNVKVQNLTTGKYIDFSYVKSTGLLTTPYTLYFFETIKGQYTRTWRLDLVVNAVNAPLPTEGTLELYTLKPFSSLDNFTFTMEGPSIDVQDAKDDLSKIKVVPNPYVVTHSAEARLLSTQTSGRGEREIRFTYIPPGAKVSIFTVRGDLIKTLYNDDLYSGDVFWNLRTDENLDVAFGVYVYVVEAPGIGTTTGKFALIK